MIYAIAILTTLNLATLTYGIILLRQIRDRQKILKMLQDDRKNLKAAEKQNAKPSVKLWSDRITKHHLVFDVVSGFRSSVWWYEELERRFEERKKKLQECIDSFGEDK